MIMFGIFLIGFGCGVCVLIAVLLVEGDEDDE